MFRFPSRATQRLSPSPRGERAGRYKGSWRGVFPADRPEHLPFPGGGMHSALCRRMDRDPAPATRQESLLSTASKRVLMRNRGIPRCDCVPRPALAGVQGGRWSGTHRPFGKCSWSWSFPLQSEFLDLSASAIGVKPIGTLLSGREQASRVPILRSPSAIWPSPSRFCHRDRRLTSIFAPLCDGSRSTVDGTESVICLHQTCCPRNGNSIALPL
jgi:hypothetical protein